MRRASVRVVALFLSLSVASLAGAESLRILTYNVGLLRALGTDRVPLVGARAEIVATEVARIAREESLDIILLEEVWRRPQAVGILAALSPLGYTEARPRGRSIVGLSTSGLLLLVRSPLEIEAWDFTRFGRTTLIETVTRKGVLEVTLRDPRSGTRFALVGTHTVALDTKDGVPVDKKQVAAFAAQAAVILAALERCSRKGELPAVLLGDFNVGPGYVDSAYHSIADAPGLREAGAVASPGGAFVTWDPANALVKYGSYPNEPPAKVDHIFLRDGSGAGWAVSGAKLVGTRPVNGLAIALVGEGTAVGVPLSDHYGFLAEVRLESR